ncbi:hypothetical protein NDU88_007707 [Pleurodeles waltl]|uniref:Uncharacterized protein n=1 Tax=Pleurodeles waltl TaxID=8319 RepID=A0AAV7U291_PLEWA|nr:hypothetical protein NDU88_007707 [Pleurodeles waltl]
MQFKKRELELKRSCMCAKNKMRCALMEPGKRCPSWTLDFHQTIAQGREVALITASAQSLARAQEARRHQEMLKAKHISGRVAEKSGRRAGWEHSQACGGLIKAGHPPARERRAIPRAKCSSDGRPVRALSTTARSTGLSAAGRPSMCKPLGAFKCAKNRPRGAKRQVEIPQFTVALAKE